MTWEKDERSPKADALAKISAEFSVPVDYFFEDLPCQGSSTTQK